jgi:hypothetical protein
MVCFCYRRRFVAPPRLNADGEFFRRSATGCYQEAGLFASATVSPTPSHRKTTRAFRSARADQKISPGRGDRGLRTEGWVGVSGDAFRPFQKPIMSMAASRRLLVQPPRVATLFKLGDGVVRHGVTLVLGQSCFQTAYDLSGAPECESYRVPKHFSLGHFPLEHIENTISSHYILRDVHEGVTTARRQREL